ncbi:MAG: glycogen debranching N-terminal domain-containing protein [Acidimicrobiia bacterium]
MTGRSETPAKNWFRPPVDGGSALVRLVEGNTFCVAGQSGDIRPGHSEGLYFLDTRLVSKLELLVDQRPVEHLSTQLDDPFSAVHVGRSVPKTGDTDTPITVVRRRHVGKGMRDEFELQNHDVTSTACDVSITIDADFADLFAVKGGQTDPGQHREIDSHGRAIEVHRMGGGAVTGIHVEFEPPPDRIDGGSSSWRVELAPNSTWNLCLHVVFWINDKSLEPGHKCGAPAEQAGPAARLASWRSNMPRVATNYAPVAEATDRATQDLGALRIFDPDDPERAVLAAGAPWFMTLFGRDSLLAGWMALMADPSLTFGVLETLAELQGQKVDPATEEQPGRILHEVRLGRTPSLSFRGGDVFYGSIDATPLFVMVTAELLRWGADAGAIGRLTPHIDRAMNWMEEYGDRDGDGYIEYERLGQQGPPNQGWKDSIDSIRHTNGDLAPTPIALCEVQGYAYAAYLGRATLADSTGDRDLAAHCRNRAAELKLAFNRDFWSEQSSRYVMALDGDKKQVDALGSNVGHCLWTGIIDSERAPQVASHLLSPDMSTGWGLRTLASSTPTYNPISYHSGSVWPHDTAIAAAGLRRYGFVEEANRLALDLFDLAATEKGRLPELVAGFSRDEFREPVPYPTSCSPQAWAAASPLLLLRTLLGLEPDLPAATVGVDPVLPPQIERLRVEGIPLAGSRLTIGIEDGEVSIEDIPPGVEIVGGRVETPGLS